MKLIYSILDYIRENKAFKSPYDFPILYYFLIVIIVFWPLSMGLFSLQNDALDVYLPWRFYGSESLRQGIVPIWNPYQDGGYPFYADHQYSIWNPELFIVSLFTRYNASTIQFLYLFYLLIAGLGFRFFLKQFKLSKKVIFLGGILFMLSGVFIGHAQSLVSIIGAVWLPWALGSYIMAINDRFSIKSTLLLILSMFLMLSSGYQAVSIMLFYVVLSIGIVRIIKIYREQDWYQLKRFVFGHLALAMVLGVLMAGVILSLYEVYPYLNRLNGLSLEDTQKLIFHPKSLGSLFFPLTASQETFNKSDVSMQNVYSGLFILFFVFYSFRNGKKHLSTEAIVLLCFGIVFGLASFGNYGFIQPILVKVLPGLDQFYYAVFYRYFAWIAGLLLACIGIQRFLESGNLKQLKRFLLLSAGFYLVFSIVNIGFSGSALGKLYLDWNYYLSRLKIRESLFIESTLHLLLLISFYLILRYKAKKALVFLFVIIELAITSQLNLPVTVHGREKSSTVNRYLSTFAEGFQGPSLEKSLADFDNIGRTPPIWRNQGNFTNLPSLMGWTSFHLNAREEVYRSKTTLEKHLLRKPFAYLSSDDGIILWEEYFPNKYSFYVSVSEESDLFVVQQSRFPGWKLKVDGSEQVIMSANGFQLGALLNKGTHKVDFEFSNKPVVFLFYFMNICFLILVMITWVVFYDGSKKRRIGIAIIVLIGVVVRVASFQPSETTKYSYLIDGQKTRQYIEEASMMNHLDENTINISIENGDLDLNQIAQLNYSYAIKSIEKHKNDHLIYFEKNGRKNLRDSIVMGGTHEFREVGKVHDLFDNYKKGGVLTIGFKTKMSSLKGKHLIIESKSKGVVDFYRSIDLEKLGGYRNVFYKGILLPEMNSNKETSIYLWNNTSDTITFSNFIVDLIEYKY